MELICGDCVEILSEGRIRGIALTVTSPPYGDVRSYAGAPETFDVAYELRKSTVDGGVCVWVVGDTVKRGVKITRPFQDVRSFLEAGWSLYDTMIYERTGTTFPSKRRYTQTFDFMFVFSKGKPRTVNLICDIPRLWEGSWGNTARRQKDGTLKKANSATSGKATARANVSVNYDVISRTPKSAPYGYKARSAIWKIANGKGYGHSDKYGEMHPASFPEILAEGHIQTWSEPGDLVCDPFCGGGTTGKMALLNGRGFVGIDISREYMRITKERLAR